MEPPNIRCKRKKQGVLERRSLASNSIYPWPPLLKKTKRAPLNINIFCHRHVEKMLRHIPPP